MAETLLSGLQRNGMQANPDKFHLMLFPPTPSEQQALQLCDGTHLMSETDVTVLGVTIDDRLCFSQHISSSCKKAARQLNAHVFLDIWISTHAGPSTTVSSWVTVIIVPSYGIFVAKSITKSLNRSKKGLLEYSLRIITPLIWSYLKELAPPPS